MVLSQSDYFALCIMASGGKMWTNEQLLAALQELHTTKSSLRSVAAAYGIPKNTDSPITLTTIPPHHWSILHQGRFHTYHETIPGIVHTRPCYSKQVEPW